MMFSVPDTPLGAALRQFMMLSEHRTTTRAQLRAAYVALSALAAREQPALPWPMPIQNGEGAVRELTDDYLLAKKRAQYAGLPVVDEATVAGALASWVGAKVNQVVAGRGMGSWFWLDLVQRGRHGPEATLDIGCPWTLAQPEPCSSDDTEAVTIPRLAALQGARLRAIHLAPAGVLVLTWSTGAVLEVRPNAQGLGNDYSLQLDEQLYYRFEGTFVARPTFEPAEEDILDVGA